MAPLGGAGRREEDAADGRPGLGLALRCMAWHGLGGPYEPGQDGASCAEISLFQTLATTTENLQTQPEENR